MKLVKEKLAIGSAVLLVVALAFVFCCPLATGMPSHGCCKKECASASMPAAPAIVATAKPSLERPLAAIATLSSSFREFTSFTFDASQAAVPQRFDPLVTIQQRI